MNKFNPTSRMNSCLILFMAIVLAEPARGQVQVGAPFLVEQDAVYLPASGEEYWGDLAKGPGEYFAVWLDIPGGLSAPGDIYGQRILPDGTFAAPGSLEIFNDTARFAHGVPAVAWNGSVYLVIWRELDLLYGARVDQFGNVLDPGGFLIHDFPTPISDPGIASDGNDFLIVQAGFGLLAGVRVGGDGTVLDADPITISAGATGLGRPDLTFADGVYMVVWAQTPNQAIRGARVTNAGLVLDPGGFNISGGGSDVDPFIDFDGQKFFVTWNRTGANHLIMAAHVTTQGQIVNGPLLLLDGQAAGFNLVGWPRVAWNGTHHLVTLITNEPLYSTTDLYAMRVDISGDPVGAPFPVSTIVGEGADAYGIASVGSQWFILWEGAEVIGAAYHFDTEGARVDSDGTILDVPHLEVATSAAWQLSSATAFDGTNFLCVYDDHREGPNAYNTNLYAVRVTAEGPAPGQPIESTGFAIDTTPNSRQRDPQVIFDGSRYAVVYVHDAQPFTGVRLVRVLPNGTVPDPIPITVYSHGSNSDTREPRIASNGTDYGIVWWDGVSPPGVTRLQYSVIGHDGTIKVPPSNIPGSGSAPQSGFDIASDGNGFVVTWNDWSSCLCLRSTGITAAGTIAGTQIINTATGGNFVAWNGQTYLAVWSQWDDSQRYVRARPLDPTGAPAGPIVQISGPHPSITMFGLFPQGDGFRLLTSGYRLFELDSNGSALEPPAVFSMSTGFEVGWTKGPGGKLLHTYSKWVSNPYNSLRIHSRFVDPTPATPADINGDGIVNVNDLLAVINSWGACPAPPPPCPADIAPPPNGDGVVNVNDLLMVINNWG